jgi:hypothetical protein
MIRFVVALVGADGRVDQGTETRPLLQGVILFEMQLRYVPHGQALTEQVTQKARGALQDLQRRIRFLAFAQGGKKHFGVREIAGDLHPGNTHHAKTWIVYLITDEGGKLALELLTHPPGSGEITGHVRSDR